MTAASSALAATPARMKSSSVHYTLPLETCSGSPPPTTSRMDLADIQSPEQAGPPVPFWLIPPSHGQQSVVVPSKWGSCSKNTSDFVLSLSLPLQMMVSLLLDPTLPPKSSPASTKSLSVLLYTPTPNGSLSPSDPCNLPILDKDSSLVTVAGIPGRQHLCIMHFGPHSQGLALCLAYSRCWICADSAETLFLSRKCSLEVEPERWAGGEGVKG